MSDAPVALDELGDRGAVRSSAIGTAAADVATAAEPVEAPSAPLTPTAWRRLFLVEVVLVLSVSLGQSAVYSLLSIVERLTRHVALNQQTSSLNQAATPDRPWLSALYQLVNGLFLFAPALLALYLLHAVGSPAAGARRLLGLDRRRWRFDVAWGLGLFAGIGIPGLGIYLAARALGLNTTVQAANLGQFWWTAPLLLFAALGNAVLEEVVMVGYLFTRSRQARFAAWLPLVVSALVRGSYHLYQGFGGFIGNLLMGLVLGAFFLRTRRLWPLVTCHFLLDAVSFVGYSLLAGHVSWL